MDELKSHPMDHTIKILEQQISKEEDEYTWAEIISKHKIHQYELEVSLPLSGWKISWHPAEGYSMKVSKCHSSHLASLKRHAIDGADEEPNENMAEGGLFGEGLVM